jgi:non-heme chloroperoxidase
MDTSSRDDKDLTLPFYGYDRDGAKVSEGARESFWLRGMLAGFPAAYFCIKAFSETDLTEDLKRIDVPTLIIHGDDDQIVPIAASARRAVQLVENATLEVTRAPRTACALPTRSGSTPISWPSSPPEDRARRLRLLLPP